MSKDKATILCSGIFFKVCYRHGKGAKETERMDGLEFIARVTSHIPDKGQVTVLYYGLYAKAQRGRSVLAGLVFGSLNARSGRFVLTIK